MRTIVRETEYDCGCKYLPESVSLEQALKVGFNESEYPPFCVDHPDAPAIRAEIDVQIDNSGIETMWLCDRKYLYSSEMHLAPLAPSNPLRYGVMIHSGFEHFWEAVKEGKDYETASVRAEDAFMEQWIDSGGLVDRARTDDMAQAIFAKYATFVMSRDLAGYKWEVEDTEVNGSIYLEKIKVGIENHNIYYVINVDMVVMCDGKRWIVDYKTHSGNYFGDDWVKPWQMSSQMTGYIATYQELLNREVAGVQIVGILIKMLKSGPQPDFLPIEIRKTQGLIDEWKKDILATYQRIIINRRSGYWPKCDKACDKWYASCPYMNVCEEDPALRHLQLENNYRTVVWDADNRKEIEIGTDGRTVIHKSRDFNIDILAQLDK